MIRSLIAQAIAHERWMLKACALGVSERDTAALWAQVTEDHCRWPWSFDVVAEADRRLLLGYAELRARPSEQWRDAAEQILVAYGLPYTPADVDRNAWALEALAGMP